MMGTTFQRFTHDNGWLIDKLTGQRPGTGWVSHGDAGQWWITSVNDRLRVYWFPKGATEMVHQPQLDEADKVLPPLQPGPVLTNITDMYEYFSDGSVALNPSWHGEGLDESNDFLSK